MKTALIGLVIASVSMVGCASSGSRTIASPAPVAAVSPQDAELESSVRDQISQNATPAAIDVSAAQGKVALRGTVADADEARRAVKSALAVEGVRGVVNNLQVGEPVDATATATATVAVSTTD